MAKKKGGEENEKIREKRREHRGDLREKHCENTQRKRAIPGPFVNFLPANPSIFFLCLSLSKTRPSSRSPSLTALAANPSHFISPPSTNYFTLQNQHLLCYKSPAAQPPFSVEEKQSSSTQTTVSLWLSVNIACK